MTNHNLNIVCISSVPWDFPIWTNRQHIMARLAKQHKVLYVFHPKLLRSTIKRNISISNSKLISPKIKINDNLTLYTPFIIPFTDKFSSLQRFNIRISSVLLTKTLKQLGYEEYILWFYDPEAVAYLDYLKPKLSCYDCVDEYSTMPYYASDKRRERLKSLETQLIKRCDLIFTTSQNLYEQKKKLNKKTFLIENVGDFDHFNRVDRELFDTLSDFPEISSPIIGFVGAMDYYKVDFNLIEFIAEKKPNWNIVLIGSKMSSKEKKHIYPTNRNIYYLGRKEYEKLPNYISKFDVCIIPYKINDYTKHVFPIKFFEFMATGKPVITTALPALMKYDESVEIAKSNEEFLTSIEKMIVHKPDKLKDKRINIAKNNTWESRKDKLLSYVQKN